MWSPQRRALTAGLVLTITLVAFEALAVATIMPAVKDDLGGLMLYGWVFSAFPLAQMIGIVSAGQQADRHGPGRPFLLGLVLFAIGLVAAGFAVSMPMLVVARAIQGFGAGAVPATAYVAIGRAYPEALRPRMFAVLATAWVVPGLAGPGLAGVVADAAGWRWVFLGLLPLVLAPGFIAVRALAKVRPEPSAGTEVPASRLPRAIRVATGSGLALAGLTGDSLLLGAVLVLAGGVVGVPALRSLTPPGMLRAAPGLPAAVLVRGMATFAFFGTDAFVPLALTDVRGTSTSFAGLAITATTLTWTVGAWVQERLIAKVGARRLVRSGQSIMVAGIAVYSLVLLDTLPLAVGVLGWALGGLGIGLTYSPLSVTVLAEAQPGREGEATSALQLTDVLGVALGTGMAGAIVATGDAMGTGLDTSLALVYAMCAAMAVGAVVVGRRLPSVRRDPRHVALEAA